MRDSGSRRVFECVSGSSATELYLLGIFASAALEEYNCKDDSSRDGIMGSKNETQ